jgi:hypothetical protein
MARLNVQVPPDVADVLHQQARILKLGRQEYVRALLCAVAADADRLRDEEAKSTRAPEPAVPP